MRIKREFNIQTTRGVTQVLTVGRSVTMVKVNSQGHHILVQWINGQDYLKAQNPHLNYMQVYTTSKKQRVLS